MSLLLVKSRSLWKGSQIALFPIHSHTLPWNSTYGMTGAMQYGMTFCRPELLCLVHLLFTGSPAVCSQLFYLVIKSLWSTQICSCALPTAIPDWRDAKWFAQTYLEKLFFFKKGLNFTTWGFQRGPAVPQRLMWTTACTDEGTRTGSLRKGKHPDNPGRRLMSIWEVN